MCPKNIRKNTCTNVRTAQSIRKPIYDIININVTWGVKAGNCDEEQTKQLRSRPSHTKALLPDCWVVVL